MKVDLSCSVQNDSLRMRSFLCNSMSSLPWCHFTYRIANKLFLCCILCQTFQQLRFFFFWSFVHFFVTQIKLFHTSHRQFWDVVFFFYVFMIVLSICKMMKLAYWVNWCFCTFYLIDGFRNACRSWILIGFRDILMEMMRYDAFLLFSAICNKYSSC